MRGGGGERDHIPILGAEGFFGVERMVVVVVFLIRGSSYLIWVGLKMEFWSGDVLCTVLAGSICSC